jgi:hypothetical protein
MSVHDDIRPLAFLFGTWVGEGAGTYPTIEPFRYREEISFTPGPGKPFVAYSQRTWRADGSEPLHSEAGYLRGFGTAQLELVIAQPTGIVEVHSGTLEGTSIVLEGKAMTTPAARSVTATCRSIRVSGDRLTYRLAMAAVDQPLQHHLEASLRRVVD